MKLKHCRTCNGCKALEYGTRARLNCGLGFRTEAIRSLHGVVTGLKPGEPCPKPINAIDVLAVRNWQAQARSKGK